jgi:hypothetical protein
VEGFLGLEALTPEVLDDPEEYLLEQARWNRRLMLSSPEGSDQREMAFYRMYNFLLEAAKVHDEKAELNNKNGQPESLATTKGLTYE